MKISGIEKTLKSVTGSVAVAGPIKFPQIGVAEQSDGMTGWSFNREKFRNIFNENLV